VGKMKNIRIGKFGGGVINIPASLPQLRKIAEEEKLQIIVVSAIGKTTNAIKDLVEGHMLGDKNMIRDAVLRIREYNETLINSFSLDATVRSEYQKHLHFLIECPMKKYCNVWGMIMDDMLARGEKMASIIISGYLNQEGFSNENIDAGDIIRTDMNFGAANVLKDECKLVPTRFSESLRKDKPVVFPGFIGRCSIQESKYPYFSFSGLTTLGREGSDYSAALLANLLSEYSGYKVEVVSLFKDVNGVANRNPKEESDSMLEYFTSLTYAEFYLGIQPGGRFEGLAHPKTVKELEEVKVPLWIKSFWHPELPGTIIS